MARIMRRAREGTRWEQDNRLYLNPWPFVVVAAIVAAIAGFAVLLALL